MEVGEGQVAPAAARRAHATMQSRVRHGSVAPGGVPPTGTTLAPALRACSVRESRAKVPASETFVHDDETAAASPLPPLITRRTREQPPVLSLIHISEPTRRTP